MSHNVWGPALTLPRMGGPWRAAAELGSGEGAGLAGVEAAEAAAGTGLRRPTTDASEDGIKLNLL